MLTARMGGLATLAALAATLLAVPQALAAPGGSLYSGPGPRPGPDVLYAKPSKAPQLRNQGRWDARPILVSGASAYRQGEFLYQDWIYDDHGARAPTRDPNDPRGESDDAFSRANGTYTYPRDRLYRENLADLVELRAMPTPRSTRFRITLNTLTKPGRVATTIALGDSPAPRDFPHGANASAPAELFLTVHGHKADLIDAESGDVVRPRLPVRIRRVAKQITVGVPHRAWDPHREVVRMAAGVGLWDREAGEYLVPGASSTPTQPGGAGGLSDPTAFFNVAFRFNEPWPDITALGGTGEVVDPAWWRDKQQGAELAQNDLSEFFAEVDFAKLRSGVRDPMRGEPGGIPRTGPMDRLLSSRFRTGQGVDYDAGCGSASECEGWLRGRLQPYGIYVPEGGEPQEGYGLTLLLHSLAANYNQFSDSNNQSQFGERGDGSIVITPSGRGPDGWYYDHAGADTFEVWADVARRYDLDPRWTAIGGYSMGGYGTYKLATQYPDLFARGQPTVGPPAVGIWLPPAEPSGGDGSNTNRMLESLRHVPMMMWAATNDELVPVSSVVAQQQRFDELGLRYVFDLFTPPADHFALAVNDEYGPAADYLGSHEARRNPAHVSYVVNPTMDFPEVGTVADHAYWLSGLRLRDAQGEAPLGKLDAFSHAFGEQDRPVNPTQSRVGTLDGGTFPAMPFAEQSKTWGQAGTAPAADRLTLDLENLRRVVVHTDRARLSCRPDLDVTTDGPARVKLAGCGRTLEFE